jgi:uncharacterized protein
MWRVARIVSGIALVGLGVVGLFLPILQGTLFLFLGLTLLARESPRVRSALVWLRSRLPHRISRRLDALRHGGIGDAR